MDEINNAVQKQFSICMYRKLESVCVWTLLSVMVFFDQEKWILPC